MDSDTTSELLKDGSDRFRLNVRALSSDNSTVGAIETVKGNTLVTFALPAGTNKVIGAEEDLLRKKLYYFVYNSNSDHSILEFDEQLVSVAKVFQDPMLNFKLENLITGIDIVELDENNHLLYWTDNWVNPNDSFEYNEPKKINIEKGKLFMAGNFVDGYPTPFDPENLFRIKQPMLLAPETVYDDDPNVSVNKLDKKLFQFKAGFVYDDKEVTAWGPISKTVYPSSGEVLLKNNVINVTVDTGIEIVKRIRIAVKEVNAADFFLVVDLDKEKFSIPSNSTYLYKFYNDGNDIPLEVNQSIKLYDRVPKRSQSQEVISGTRLTDGLITEEFDPVDVDLKLDFSFDFKIPTYSVGYPTITASGSKYLSRPNVTITPPAVGVTATAEVTLSIVGIALNNVGFGYIAGPVVTIVGGGGSGATATATHILGSLTSITITNTGSGYTSLPSVVISGGGTGATAVVDDMRVSGIVITNAGTGYTTVPTVTIDFPTGSGGTVAQAQVALVPGPNLKPNVSLKRGGVYDYGLIYYDHGNRSSLTNINEGRFDVIQDNGNYGTTLFVPFYTEHNPLGAAILDFTMKVDGIRIVDAGTGYTGATVFTFSPPASGVTATGTPVIGVGSLSLLTITSVGSGYTPDGTYTGIVLTGGSGTGAKVDFTVVGGLVDEYAINTAGSGYITGEVLTVDPSTFAPPPGSDATFTIESDYQTITGVIVTNAGSGYTSMPTVTVTDSGGGINADIEATMAVSAVTIVSGSTGYTSAPLATFTGGDPVINATVTTAISSGRVTSTSLTNVGQGYVSFPTLTVAGRIYGDDYPVISWKIYNEPPSWATHYQIARTHNNAFTKYLQFVMGITYYLPVDGVTPLAYGDPSVVQIAIDINHPITTTFSHANPGSILVYDFAPGDRIRFIKDENGNFYTGYYDFEIGSFNTSTGIIYVQFPPGTYPNVPNFNIGTLYEIYHPIPNSESVDRLTFEIGEGDYIALDSNGDYYHKGNGADQKYWLFTTNQFVASPGGYTLGFTSNVPHGLAVGDEIKIVQDTGFTHPEYNAYFTVTIVVNAFTIGVNGAYLSPTPTQSGRSISPAKGDFSGGDTFYRIRVMQAPPSGSVSFLIEDHSYSDTTLLKGYDYGRPNRIDPQITEVTRLSTVYYSENLIPETNINGLSSVFDTSFETYDSKFGGIYKLYSEDSNLIMFQELKIGNIPVEKIIYNDLQGGTTVGASANVLSDQALYYAGEFGIGRNPESFAVYAKAKYGVDPRRGTPWRLSVDGLTPVGDTGNMHNYFNDKCRAILANGSRVNIYGTYDIRFNEYIAAFDTFTNGAVVFPAETIAWNEKSNGWSTFYSYAPEFMCSNGVDIVSFKNGAIYTHNTNPIHNNFYGVQYPSEVWCVLNADPSNVKILEAVSQECLSIWTVPEISNTNGQVSNLIASDFQMKEGMQYAPVWRDTNTPNIIPPALPLFEGDEMRAQTFLVKFRYDGTTYNKLFAVNFNYIISNLHN